MGFWEDIAEQKRIHHEKRDKENLDYHLAEMTLGKATERLQKLHRGPGLCACVGGRNCCLIRDKAARMVVAQGEAIIARLKSLLATRADPFGFSQVMMTLNENGPRQLQDIATLDGLEGPIWR